MTTNRTAFVWLVCILLALTATARGDIFTYTFTSTGSGTIGSTSFSDAVVTATLVGDTATRFEASWYPGAFFVVASSLELNISGVGTATFLDPGYFGGQGFVFVIQEPLYIPEAYVGWGSYIDHGRVGGSVFSSYDLGSPIGPLSGNGETNFDPSYYNVMTTLGLLTYYSSVGSTFTATAGTAVPEGGALAPLVVGLVGIGLFILRRRTNP